MTKYTHDSMQDLLKREEEVLESQWISVDDRLPTDEERFNNQLLILTYMYGLQVAHFTKDGIWVNRDTYVIIQAVILWMIIPQWTTR